MDFDNANPQVIRIVTVKKGVYNGNTQELFFFNKFKTRSKF